MTSQPEIHHLRQRLTDEGNKVADFFAGLPPQAWDHPVYSTGSQWRVRQVLAHFVSAERGYLHYMRDTVDGGPGVPRDFDIDAFNAAQVAALEGLSTPQLLEGFRQVRGQTATFIENLEATDLDRIGYHPWFGEESLRFLLKLIYRHPMLHVRDVRLALEAGAPVPDGQGYASFARDPSASEGK